MSVHAGCSVFLRGIRGSSLVIEMELFDRGRNAVLSLAGRVLFKAL